MFTFKNPRGGTYATPREQNTERNPHINVLELPDQVIINRKTDSDVESNCSSMVFDDVDNDDSNDTDYYTDEESENQMTASTDLVDNRQESSIKGCDDKDSVVTEDFKDAVSDEFKDAKSEYSHEATDIDVDDINVDDIDVDIDDTLGHGGISDLIREHKETESINASVEENTDVEIVEEGSEEIDIIEASDRSENTEDIESVDEAEEERDVLADSKTLTLRPVAPPRRKKGVRASKTFGAADHSSK